MQLSDNIPIYYDRCHGIHELFALPLSLLSVLTRCANTKNGIPVRNLKSYQVSYLVLKMR